MQYASEVAERRDAGFDRMHTRCFLRRIRPAKKWFVGRGAEISLSIHCEIVTPDSALLLGSTHNLPQPLSKDHRWLFNQEMEDTRQAKYANQINWEIAELQMASTDINQSK